MRWRRRTAPRTWCSSTGCCAVEADCRTPANVLLARDGCGWRRVKICDFSFARVAAEEGEDAVLEPKGTLPYMACELFRETPLRATAAALAAVDVCALGRVVNEAATGKVPWADAMDIGLQFCLKHGRLPPGLFDADGNTISRHEERPELWLGLAAVVRRCCHKDWEKRPRAMEVAGELEALATLPVT